MAAHPAFALDGPLKDVPNLTVGDQGECEGWPCAVTWHDENGAAHEYRFESMSISRGRNTPVYKFVPSDDD